MDAKQMPRTMAVVGVAAALGGGSVAAISAATGSAAGTPTTPTPTPSLANGAPPGNAAHVRPGAAPGRPGWGAQRSDETPLTGDARAKVTAIAKEKVPGGTAIRVETDADGKAAYEAHMTSSSGAPVTVYVDKDFKYVSTETRP